MVTSPKITGNILCKLCFNFAGSWETRESGGADPDIIIVDPGGAEPDYADPEVVMLALQTDREGTTGDVVEEAHIEDNIAVGIAHVMEA